MEESPQESKLHILDYWRVIRSRKEIILAVTLLIALTGAAFTFTLPKIFRAESKILVRQDAMDIDVFERQFVSSYNPFFMRTQYRLIQAKPILNAVIRDLRLDEEWGKKMNESGDPLAIEIAYSILLAKLNVQQFRDTSLISIQVESEDAAEAARIANYVGEVYREHRLSEKRREVQRAIDALQNEFEKQQVKVNKAEDALEAIREERGVSEISSGLRVDKMRLSQLEGERITARVSMLVNKARYEQMNEMSGSDPENIAAFGAFDGTLMGLRNNMLESEISLRVMLEKMGNNHPDVRQTRAGLEAVREKIQEAIAGVKKTLEKDYLISKEKYSALVNEIELARASDIEAERDRFLPFDKAERNLKIQRDILNALRSRIAQEGIELEVPSTVVEIVDPADPPRRPVSPKVILNIMISLIMGLGAGVGLAFFIEYLDTSVKTVDDVERFLSLPVLGVIPQKVRPLIEEGAESPHAEAYRVLRTNIQFSNKGIVGGAYGVVSGGAGEGKSTTLFNLAYVCAQLGDKVLIVDSDLRRPVQHTILGMSNRFGLTNVLMRDVPIEETIKSTSVPNLHFLPSGKLPRTSLGLLDSTKMRELIKNLKARYDFVFFDSPPVLGVSDASVLASEVDGVLLVVQYRKYPKDMSLRARRMVDNVGGNVMGVVLNNINILRDDYYYYYHSYYSHYYTPDESDSVENDTDEADASAVRDKV